MKIKITPQQLNGTIEAIPSKSHAHRLLIAQKLASLQGCGQEIPLVIPTFSEDIDATKAWRNWIKNFPVLIAGKVDRRSAL